MKGNSGPLAGRVLPAFKLDQMPPLTAFAASIYATMLFPGTDEGLERYQYAQAIGLDWRARYGPGSVEEPLPVLRRELFTLLDFAKRFPHAQLAARQTEGISAGYLLKYVLLLDRDTTVEVASMKKAIALLVKVEPVSQRTLQTRWSAFQDVSHLWAALSDFRCNLQKVGPEWAITAWLAFMKDPRPVIATAEHYRHWGVQFQPKGSRGHRVLNSKTAWRTSEHGEPLPTQDFFNPELLYLGLTEETRELLERYRR
jgi:hypothetical protein